MGRKELLVLMVGASTINYIGRTAMAVAGPDIAKQYQFSEAELGQIFSAFWLGYGLMMWPSGWVADRFGAGKVLGICGLVTALLLAGNAAMSLLAGFLLLRLLFGVASAVLYPACGNLTMLAFPSEKMAGVQGLVVGGSNFGAALAPFFVVWVSKWGGWRGAFLAVAALTLVFFAIWLARVRMDTPGAEKKAEFLRLRKPLVLLALQGFCIGYFYSFGDTWSFYYFREVRHFSEEQSALFSTLLQVAGGIMMPLGGWISDVIAPRFGRIRPALLALAVSGVLLAASTSTQAPTAVLAFITAAYSLVVACEGVYSWALLTRSADAPAAGFGFANGVGSGAQFLAPLALPWIAGRWGWDAAVYSAAFACFLGAVLWRWAGAD
ncbi:MAG: MFS transporter [Acidobacteria bacterium]|nr:MFS transporter [Acidobacteriota bacterium]